MKIARFLQSTPFLLALVGCFRNADVSEIFCVKDDNCPSGYFCADSTRPGGCARRPERLDAGTPDVSNMIDGNGFLDVEVGRGADSPPVNLPTLDGNRSTDANIEIDVPEHFDLEAQLDLAMADAPGADLALEVTGSTRYDATEDHPHFDATGKTNGEPCQTGSQCVSGICAEGTCCADACTGQCQSCNVPGKVGACTAVSGAPPASKPACPGSGGCAGICDGNSPSCIFPGPEITCASPSCASGVATSARTCNGAGNCGTPMSTPCGSYACGSSACLSSCNTASDCAANAVCASGICVGCSSGQTACANQCVNLQMDNSHCGSCTATPCASGRQCSAGVCKLADGQACSSGPQCASGICNTYYYDGDADGYPVSGNSVGYCNLPTSPSSSYIAARSDGAWDCCDSDSTVNPGVVGYFIDTNNSCHTWDWDCSGQPEKKQVQIAGPCWFESSSGKCVSTTAPGYPSSDCGGAYPFSISCSVTTPGNCTTLTSQNAPVACH
jgi:hypothetical protein